MKSSNQFSGTRIHSAGFSLIEVLVSIIVLSFGLLGVVGLQAAALKANREAMYQSAATRLGRDMGEMMRGNRAIAALTSGNPYVISFNRNSYSTSSDAVTALEAATPITANKNCWINDCYSTSDDAARTDIGKWQARDWLFRVYAELPDARVAICFDETPFDASGLPQWTCTNAGAVMVIKVGWTRASVNSQPASESNAFDRANKPGIIFPVTL
jgi:type IV pilus assembly protein PilV